MRPPIEWRRFIHRRPVSGRRRPYRCRRRDNGLCRSNCLPSIELMISAVSVAALVALANPVAVSITVPTDRLVEAYNLATLGTEAFFGALKKLIAEMEEEERRAAREGLTEEELAVFDLLTRPEPKLTKTQELEVKKVAHHLLEKLQALRVEMWRKNQQTRAAVHSEIRFILNELPEDPYPQSLWDQKVDAVWQFIYHQAAGVPREGTMAQ